MSIDSNGRNHAAAGTPGGGQFQADRRPHDESVNLSRPTVTYDVASLNVSGFGAHHFDLEHGLSADGVGVTLDALGIDAALTANAPATAFTCATARTFGYTRETHTPRWVTIHGAPSLSAVIFQPNDAADYTSDDAVAQLAQHAAVGERLQQGDLPPTTVPFNTAADTVNVESRQARGVLYETVGRKAAGWLMHGRDAATFGYDVQAS
jgi:hypothetical protein